MQEDSIGEGKIDSQKRTEATDNQASGLNDITPVTVSPEIYQETKDRLTKVLKYQIFTINHPRSIEEMQAAGEIVNAVRGPGEDEFGHSVPPPIEIAIDPKNPFLPNSQGLTLEQQRGLLKEYEESFIDKEEPEYTIKGVKAGFLPAAIIGEADTICRREIRRPIVPAKVTNVTDPDGVERINFSAQYVTCADDIGKDWVVQFGRSGSVQSLTKYGDEKPIVNPVTTRNPNANAQTHVLRAVVLPVPAK